MYVLLILDCLFWGLIAPLLNIPLWIVLRLASLCCSIDPETRLRVATPWDVILNAWNIIHGIRMLDADGEHGLIVPNVADMRGALIMNHRTWSDFVVDPAQGAATVVARTAAVAVTLLGGVTGLLSRRVIMIQRGKTSRQQLMALCAKHERYLIYPEGTRRANAADKDEPAALRAGGLKNVYEAGDALHIIITVGKEDLVNEKKGILRCGVTLFRARHPPIHAKDFNTFEKYLAHVEKAWVMTWRRAYAFRETEQRNAEASPASTRRKGVELM